MTAELERNHKSYFYNIRTVVDQDTEYDKKGSPDVTRVREYICPNDFSLPHAPLIQKNVLYGLHVMVYALSIIIVRFIEKHKNHA